MTNVTGVSRFERFFREAGGLQVDKDDLKRYTDFVNTKVADLVIRAQAVAKDNGRDLIWLADIPITKGLQESIQRFKKIDSELELTPLLEHLAGLPQLHLGYSLEAEEAIGNIAGGLSVALAGTLRLIDPEQRHPYGLQWERCFQIFSLLL